MESVINQGAEGMNAKFPHGKLNKDDEGAINMATAVNVRDRTVIIQFPKPVLWIGLPLAHVKYLRDKLNEYIGQLES